MATVFKLDGSVIRIMEIVEQDMSGSIAASRKRLFIPEGDLASLAPAVYTTATC